MSADTSYPCRDKVQEGPSDPKPPETDCKDVTAKKDTLWAVRNGCLGVYFLTENRAEGQVIKDSYNTGEYCKASRRALRADMPLCIRLYDHIFGRMIYVAMGERGRCADLLRQLTDTKGNLDARLKNNSGLCLEITEDTCGIWVRETWQELRDPTNVTHLSHEALHACEWVMDKAGMKPHRQNEELRAYYQEWIVAAVTELIKLDIDDWCDMLIEVSSVSKTKEVK